MTRQTNRLLVLVAVLISSGWLAGGSVLAQTTSASVAGKVQTADGKPQADAVVQARSAETGAMRTALTNERGEYRIEGLISGSWVFVARLATGEISFGDTRRRLQREFAVAVMNGIALGSLIFVIIYLWDRDYLFGILLAISLLFIIINASLFGAVIPILFKKLNVDPALATGPFVTTFNDVVGLMIYFTLLTFGYHFVL